MSCYRYFLNTDLLTDDILYTCFDSTLNNLKCCGLFLTIGHFNRVFKIVFIFVFDFARILFTALQ